MTRLARLGLTAAIAAIGMFWLFSLRPGTPWGDDWAMYVHHAKNLVTGRPYDATGLIHNPHFPTYAPRTYAPGFPLLLVPLYATFGVHFTALKIPVVASFLLALVAMAVYCRRELSTAALVLVVLAVGFNPANWELKDYILADFPFLLFVMLSALAIDRFYVPGSAGGRRGVLIGLLVYAAYAMRPVAALFIGALVAFDLAVHRRISRPCLVVGATVGGLAILQALVFGFDGSYLAMFARYREMGPGAITTEVIGRAASYRLAAADLWTLGIGALSPRQAYADVVWALATAGLVVRMAARVSPVEIFVLAYVATIFAFPGYQGIRFLSPLLPFAFAYVLGLVDRVPRPALRWAALVAVVGPLAWWYGTFYGQPDSWSRPGPHTPAAGALFEYVRAHTATDAVFVLGKPRAFSLYTERAAAVYHDPADKAELIRYIRGIGARYVVTGIPDNASFDDWVASEGTQFRGVYQAGGVGLFETRP
jgi:hypothetical protein